MLKVTFWVVFLGFVGYLGIYIAPMYVDNYYVQSAMDKTIDDIKVSTWRKNTIKSKIDNYLYVDSADKAVDLNQALSVHRKLNKGTITIKYQKEIPLFEGFVLIKTFTNTTEKTLEN